MHNKNSSFLKINGNRATSIILLVLILLIITLFRPLDTSSLFSKSNPVGTYELAVSKIEELTLLDTPEINPVCHTIFMDHGRKTEKVLIIYHGYTNCPHQFEQLGKMFYDKGYNVFIPRIPHHGLSDRLTNDLSNLTAEELVQLSDNSIDIAQGLGDKIYVTGISAGGVMAAWVAQFRDVEKVVSIAPIFFYSYPKVFVTPLTNLAFILPEKYRFWSDDEAERLKGPQYAYPRYSQKAIAQVFLLGKSVFNSAQNKIPKAKSTLFITIEGDEAINSELPYDLIKLWKDKGADVASFEFSKKEAPIHDIINPNQEEERTEYIYPILIDLIDS